MMYDDKLRPYIGKPQSLPLEVLAIINPQTKWGIAMLNSIVWFVSWSGIGKLLKIEKTAEGGQYCAYK